MKNCMVKGMCSNDDCIVTFELRWATSVDDLLEQFKSCESEDELLELIKDNMLISIPCRCD